MMIDVHRPQDFHVYLRAVSLFQELVDKLFPSSQWPHRLKKKILTMWGDKATTSG